MWAHYPIRHQENPSLPSDWLAVTHAGENEQKVIKLLGDCSCYLQRGRPC